MNIDIILENGNNFICKNIKRFEYKADELTYYIVSCNEIVYKFSDSDIYRILITSDIEQIP